MSDPFLDTLARHGDAVDLNQAKVVSAQLNGLSAELAALIFRCGESSRQDILLQFSRQVTTFINQIDVSASQLPPPANHSAPRQMPAPEKLTPEFLEEERRTFNKEECIAGIRDIRENGGTDLREILRQLESGGSPS